MKGGDGDKFEILFWHLPGGGEGLRKTVQNFSWDN